MRKRIFLLLCDILLGGCASDIQSRMITADTALITAIGRNPTDQAKVVDASLTEAAKVTRDHGYRYFVIVSAADASSIGRTIVPSRAVQEQTLRDGAYGTSTLLPASDAYGIQTKPGESERYYKPGLDITIRMYREGEINPKSQGVWNPDVILGNGQS
jgi:hypothetical protein